MLFYMEKEGCWGADFKLGSVSWIIQANPSQEPRNVEEGGRIEESGGLQLQREGETDTALLTFKM